MTTPVSVLILTLDEETNLPRCLTSLQWCNDIVVLDSGSRDLTQVIATDFGARVVERTFDNYAAQRNFGLKDITYVHPWVLMVDADEEVPSALIEEIIQTITECDEKMTLFRMRRQDHFLGKWIRRSSGYPTWFGRLVRPDKVSVEREINEEFVTDGQIGFLKNHLRHYPFNKGFASWIEKHNRYSTMEAKLIQEGGLCAFSVADLKSGDPACRRRAIKSIVYRLPFRPLWMFLALYILRGGFLDGQAGLIFCLLRSYYEFMINCKLREIKLRLAGRPL
ncbi:MAG: glycosyltransferase involved in cell wall biosynthesis [Desulforhopalus sp.]|jgi:glycosyltransferase involved in cell wall biosynthesis